MSRPDNTLIVMWAAKGGSGTTVTAAAAALHEAQPVLLVDLDGDAAAVFGMRQHELGIRAWLASDAEPDRLIEFTDRIDATTSLIQAGTADPERGIHRSERLDELATWLKQQPCIVIVDSGTGLPIPELHFAADRNVLVTRADYLALTAASRALLRPDEVFVVDEPGRALTHTDIEHALHAPIVGHVDVDPAIARAVDAGLFVGHTALHRATTRLTASDSFRLSEPERRPRAPEVDYGAQWRSRHSSDTWRLSYDPASKALNATNNRTGTEVGFGTYPTVANVEHDLAGWAVMHAGPDGLDWLTNQLGLDPATLHESLPDMDPPSPSPLSPDFDLGMGL